MDIWTQARERYAAGGVTHRQLAEELGLPLGALRRRSAEEKWMELKKQHGASGSLSDAPAARLRMDKQLALTDRLLDVCIGALENGEDEFYSYVETQKGEGWTVAKLDVINIDRVAKIIKAVGDIFELQRLALGLHDYKDELSARKLEQDCDIAHLKLDLERMKLEGQTTAPVCDDGFLEALGLDPDGNGELPCE